MPLSVAARRFRQGLLSCAVLFNPWLPALAQENAYPQLTRVDEGAEDIILDGFLDEAVWSGLPVIDGMRVINPDTLAEAPYETHTRIFYTERGIYVGAMNYQPPGSLVARMTSRDIQLDRDGFVVGIDASGSGLYGFFLRINLGDSMTDASLLPERQMNMQWDGAWNGRTQPLENGWSVEYFIPWSMMALPQTGDVRRIGIYLERQVGHLGGEAWSNPPLPRTVNQYLSAFTKYELRDIEPRRQLTFYPYMASSYDGMTNENEVKAGTEIFWRPSTNTLLSATLNPDFGNVESDDVIINFSAFETFYPEKRAFFLEGQDIFNTSPRSSGFHGPGGPISILNTRRIGGAARYQVPAGVAVVPTDLSQPTELLGAGKFTGQTGKWRYGTLLATENDSQIRGIGPGGSPVTLQAEGRDFVVARVLYEDTAAGGRRSIGWIGTDVVHPDRDATVNGVDVHYFSADNRWVVDGQLLHSAVDGVNGAGAFADMGFRPQRGVQHQVSATYMDDKLNINDLGFLTRNDQVNLEYNYFRNESDVEGLRGRSTALFVTNRWNTDLKPVILRFSASRGYTLLDNTNINFNAQYYPPRIDDRLGRGSGDFKIAERWGADTSFNTDRARPVSWDLRFSGGQEDLGVRTLATSAGVAWRPNDRFNVNLSAEYTDREALLVYRGGGRFTSFEATQWSPRVESDFFISPKQQFRLTMQWTGLKAFEDKFWQVAPSRLDFLTEVSNPDNQPDDFVVSRLSFQARYRWEIAPLSDLFIVYTRGGNIPGSEFDEYPEMFQNALEEKVVDTFVIKLRYRLGS